MRIVMVTGRSMWALMMTKPLDIRDCLEIDSACMDFSSFWLHLNCYGWHFECCGFWSLNLNYYSWHFESCGFWSLKHRSSRRVMWKFFLTKYANQRMTKEGGWQTTWVCQHRAAEDGCTILPIFQIVRSFDLMSLI